MLLGENYLLHLLKGSKEMKELQMIQAELKAPKSQTNKFGGYKFRSLEDINESVKPLLTKYNCTLVIYDEMVMLGDRFYIKATAVLKNESGDTEIGVGWARESLAKKGMDDSQITGTASSYARKYACNGLFCIDDTKDADTNQYHDITYDELATEVEKKTFLQRCEKDGQDYKKIAKQAGAVSMKTMTKDQVGKALIILKEIEDEI